MATHMMCVRMAPLLPMSAPTVVSSGWLSMKPSAHRAHPEYELSTVMTTGISSPPMEAVMCRPRPPERAVIPMRAAKPVAGLGFATKSPMQPSVATPATAFIWSRMGRLSASLLRFPLSLEGDEGASGGDAADDGRERDGGEPHPVEQLGAVRAVRHEVAHACEDGGQTDERVEGGHCLRQRSRVDLGADAVAERATAAQHRRELHVLRGVPVHTADGRSKAEGDPSHAAHVAHAGGFLVG